MAGYEYLLQPASLVASRVEEVVPLGIRDVFSFSVLPQRCFRPG